VLGHSRANPLPHDVGRAATRVDHSTLPVDLPGVRCRRLRAGEVLIPEGAVGAVVVVQTGALTLAITGRGGRRAVVGVVGPGDLLGVESILLQADGEPRRPMVRPEARAITAGTTILLPPHELERAVRRDAALAGWLARSLGDRIGDLQLRLGWTLSLGVHERILGVLRWLAGRWGSPTTDGIMVDLPLSQELLGSMVGASRETVNRALRDLEASGAVARSGRRYVVADPSG
jgi:CRP-like cAMP-binding protein